MFYVYKCSVRTVHPRIATENAYFIIITFFNVLCLHDDVDMMMPYENVFVYGWLQYVCILIEAYIFCVVIIYCVVYFHVSTVHARHDIQFK